MYLTPFQTTQLNLVRTESKYNDYSLRSEHHLHGDNNGLILGIRDEPQFSRIGAGPERAGERRHRYGRTLSRGERS